MCIYMMKLYGINKVYYSDDNGMIRSEKVATMNENYYSKGLESVMKNNLIYYRKLPLPKSIKQQINKNVKTKNKLTRCIKNE